MRFKKAIWIPIYVLTDEELQLQELIDLPEDAGLSMTEDRAFWCIDSAGKSRTEKIFTYFYSSGECYYTPINLKSFVELIDEHIKNCEL